MSSRILKQPVVGGIYYYCPPRNTAPEKAVEPGPAPEEPVGSDKDPAAGPPAAGPPAAADPAGRKHPERYVPSAEEIDRWARRGFEKGKAEAEARYRGMLEAALKKLKKMEREANLILQEARQKARQIVAASEANMVEISMAIAEKLIKSQLETTPRAVAQIVRESVKKLPSEEPATVYVSPQDLPACLAELGPDGSHPEPPVEEILPDEKLSRGSCRLESASGTVEYLLDEELKKIRAVLLEMAAEETAELPEEIGAYDEH